MSLEARLNPTQGVAIGMDLPRRSPQGNPRDKPYFGALVQADLAQRLVWRGAMTYFAAVLLSRGRPRGTPASNVVADRIKA